MNEIKIKDKLLASFLNSALYIWYSKIYLINFRGTFSEENTESDKNLAKLLEVVGQWPEVVGHGLEDVGH